MDAGGSHKHPQRAKRWMAIKALKRLAKAGVNTGMAEEPPSQFDRVYRVVRSFAYPDLVDHQGPASNVVSLERDADATADAEHARRKRWRAVGWMVEGWWLSGIFSADPMDSQQPVEQMVRDDPGQATPWNAINGYRYLAGQAYELFLDQAALEDGEQATRGVDRAYGFLDAVALPVVQRLPSVEEQIAQVWADHGPGEAAAVTRARRMDTVPYIVEAWHRSSVLGRPVVGFDPEAEALLEGVFSEVQDGA